MFGALPNSAVVVVVAGGQRAANSNPAPVLVAVAITMTATAAASVQRQLSPCKLPASSRWCWRVGCWHSGDVPQHKHVWTHV